MSPERVNHKALFISVLISAVISTLIMAFVSGYGEIISPDGAVKHFYNLDYVILWAPILFMLMAPVIAIVAYLFGLVLIKGRLFSLPIVTAVGGVGGGLVISALSGNWLMFSMVGAYYVATGAVSAVTCFYLYKKFNKA